MKKDTTLTLRHQFEGFLYKLKAVIDTYPQYEVFDYSKNGITRNDVLGAPMRWLNRAWYGEVGRLKEEHQYRDLLNLLKDFHAKGVLFKSALYDSYQTLEDKMSVLVSLSQNVAAVHVLLDYFAASTTIRLIQQDIAPLMRSLAACKRIVPSEEFITAFKELMQVAADRSTTVIDMLSAIDLETDGMLTEDDSKNFEQIRQRFAGLAKISNLATAFVFVESGEKQQSPEMKVEQEIAALREFHKTFDLKLLAPFLLSIKAWKSGTAGSTAIIVTAIHSFIAMNDRATLKSGGLERKVYEITTDEWKDLAQTIDYWRMDRLSEDTMMGSIAVLRDKQYNNPGQYQ
ncbi:MAG: hypothetical protein M3R00_03770 [Pseudomonadota bacterium]|nr:hypothetical protein [Pseudomonadota bacterium]